MQIVNKKIDELKAYENNPRINDKAFSAVANSIKEFGFKVPVIIDADNVIVAGHTRIKAAQSLGLETVPCIIADDLTDEQIKAFRIADNRAAELADWDVKKLFAEIEELKTLDFDINKLGFEEKELKGIADEYAQLIDAEAEAEDDGFNLELPEEPKTKPGDLYNLGEHRLLCGDATKIEDYSKLMSGVQADLLLTDVPYNVDYTGKTKDELKIKSDKMSNEDYSRFIGMFADEALSVCKAGAALYIWHASMYSDIVIPEFRRGGGYLNNF